MQDVFCNFYTAYYNISSDDFVVLTKLLCTTLYGIYSVIQKDGHSFVSLYFKIRTSDKYDVNYISLYSKWSFIRQNARCTTVTKF